MIDGTYDFQIRRSNKLFLNARNKSDFGYLCQELILRKLHNNIKRIYSVQQTDRNIIVRQIKLLLAENTPMWVVRLDVRHFYESIDRNRLIYKMTDDARLSHNTLVLLQKLFANPVISGEAGLPRGLGISAAMSELYLKYFDLDIKRIEGVYYYARFVDDIIAFCSSESSRDKVRQTAEKGLESLGLELNSDKSYDWQPKDTGKDLTYLGYTFRKEGEKSEVKIAEKKVNAIKTRLTKSFVRFAKDRDFDMLKLRIKYLTGNFTLYQSKTLTPIKVGIHFNYKLATDLSDLTNLDSFYQKLLHCQRGSLGARIALTKAQVKQLEKYSFRFGFDKHVNHHFTVDQMVKITNCWQ